MSRRTSQDRGIRRRIEPADDRNGSHREDHEKNGKIVEIKAEKDIGPCQMLQEYTDIDLSTGSSDDASLLVCVLRIRCHIDAGKEWKGQI